MPRLSLRDSLCKLYNEKFGTKDQELFGVLWAKWTVSRLKSALWSDESKFDILENCVLWAKEEEEDPPGSVLISSLHDTKVHLEEFEWFGAINSKFKHLFI